MDHYVKMDVALDILNGRIAATMRKLEKNKNKNIQEELDLLLQARQRIYDGDEKMIERIINQK